MHHSQMNSEVRRLIADGTVLPAHPLALDANRKLDTKHQRALTRYYIDAGAGGLAVEDTTGYADGSTSYLKNFSFTGGEEDMYSFSGMTAANGESEFVVSGLMFGSRGSASLISSSQEEKASNANYALFQLSMMNLIETPAKR